MTKPRVCFVGNLITLPYSPDHAGVIQGFEKLGIEYQAVDPHQLYSTNTDIADIITEFKPDLIIHGMTDSLSNKWPLKLKETLPGAIQVMSMWDYRPTSLNYDNLWGGWKECGQALDLITLSNRDQLAWWEKDFGVETMFWPHGCYIGDLEFDRQYEHDTVFVGGRNEASPYEARVHLIDSINQQTPITWINKGGGDSNPERIKVWKDLGKIYYSAKTALDVSHFWDADGYASGRYFYTAGLGACSISKRFPNCEELYPEGTKIYFDTVDEAVDKIKFYVEHEVPRNMVKRAAYDWTKKYHTYEVRFKELFEKLDIKL